jgi:hypothetical protein
MCAITQTPCLQQGLKLAPAPKMIFIPAGKAITAAAWAAATRGLSAGDSVTLLVPKGGLVEAEEPLRVTSDIVISGRVTGTSGWQTYSGLQQQAALLAAPFEGLGGVVTIRCGKRSQIAFMIM